MLYRNGDAIDDEHSVHTLLSVPGWPHVASSPLVDGELTGESLPSNRSEKRNVVTLELYTSLWNAPSCEEGIEGYLVGQGRRDLCWKGREIVVGPVLDEKYVDEIDELTDKVYDCLTSRPYPTAMTVHGALIGTGFVLSLRCGFLVAGSIAERGSETVRELEVAMVSPE